MTGITIPASITNIGGAAFSLCNGLSSVAIPGSVTAIGDSAFCECAGLTGITIPDGVGLIGNEAFGWCTNLAVLTISDGVTSVGDGAFEGCTGLTSAIIPGSVTNVGNGAFWGCAGLADLTIGNGVTSIGPSAFYECGFTTISIPSSVTIIGQRAFAECWRLNTVTIGSGVTSIGASAFEWCQGLASAYFQGNAPSAFGSEVFYDDYPSGVTIYYPSTASGWSYGVWNNYVALPYAYTAPAQRPALAMIPGSGAVTPSFNALLPGTNYQLQVSADLSNWSNSGLVFTATNASAAYTQPFYVTNWNRLFFRLAWAR